MIFTSYTYVAFLGLTFLLCWSIPPRFRNWVLVIFSYIFYGSWLWPFIFLLLGVSLFTFYFARLLAGRPDPRRLLAVGVVIELLPLIYYKYLGFILSNFSDAFRLFGVSCSIPIPSVFIPLGISFFTFQGIAYLVDVAAGELPIPRITQFLLYKAFWPQLIAGPIIRPGEIRDQIGGERSIDFPAFAEGSTRILLGFFKKIVLADNLSPIVDSVFLPGAHPAFTDAAVGIFGFGLQIYFDFSAYSDIAVGSARLFGFRFPENFDFPYAARSPQEFWDRWHMTLSRWVRDYVYTPLSFATRTRPHLAVLWLLLAMAVCGFWHGAKWTFVVWGVWHGGLLVLAQTWGKPLFGPQSGNRVSRGFVGGVAAVATFGGVMLGWVFFRSETIGQAWDLIHALFTVRGGFRPAVLRENAVLIVALVFSGLLMVQAAARFLPDRFPRLFDEGGNGGYAIVAIRAVFYSVLLVLVVVFDREAKAFVYFQF